jgi:hypothetical protein
VSVQIHLPAGLPGGLRSHGINMKRVVVVDDHPIFRKGLVALLRASDYEVVGEA